MSSMSFSGWLGDALLSALQAPWSARLYTRVFFQRRRGGKREEISDNDRNKKKKNDDDTAIVYESLCAALLTESKLHAI